MNDAITECGIAKLPNVLEARLNFVNSKFLSGVCHITGYLF